MQNLQIDKPQKSSGTRKFLAAAGIFLVAIGIFLAAFGISFKMLMLPESSRNGDGLSEADTLRVELSELQEENRRLEEENKILKGDSDSSAKTSDKD